MAISKFQPAEKILEAFDAGQRIFGESRVQELQAKASALPEDIKWHFIGHLQTNKVRQLLAVKSLHLIQSVDSVRLLRLIDTEAERAGTVADVLLEVHVAQEDTKYGFSPAELVDWIMTEEYKSLKATRIRGIMGMASNTDNQEQLTMEFGQLALCFHQVLGVAQLPDFSILSMGMSGDYPIAIAEGSTMVRIGSSIFGER